jgi:hypothetical protein
VPASRPEGCWQRIATRLTQRNKREVKGSNVPEVKRPTPEHVCSGCGKPIQDRSVHCADCAGLRATCSRDKSSRCSRAFQPLLFDHDLVSRVGMQGKSGRVTPLIHGTGWRWRSWLVFPQTQPSGTSTASIAKYWHMSPKGVCFCFFPPLAAGAR